MIFNSNSGDDAAESVLTLQKILSTRLDGFNPTQMDLFQGFVSFRKGAKPVIKAISFDIDGILIANRSKALESTKQATEYAWKNGILCGVVMRRSPIKIKETTGELELDMYVVYNDRLASIADRTIIDHPFK